MMIETPPSTANESTIDVSLLRGLEPIMSREEQAQVSSLLVSGDNNGLAKAAKILYEVTELLKNGTLFHQRSDEDRLRMEASFQTNFTEPKENENSTITYGLRRQQHRPAYNDYEMRVRKEKASFEAKQAAQQLVLPLPIRMPRLVIINTFDPNGTPVPRRRIMGGGTRMMKPSLTFVDDEWDGTLGAAFTKLEVKTDRPGPSNLLLRIRPCRDSSGADIHVIGHTKKTPGFHQIAGRLEGGYSAKLVQEAEPRLLIASAANDAAKLGLQRGDVVTHVNGEEFRGTSQDLNMLIKALFSSGAEEDSDRLELVVNAEICVAEALRLRSISN